MAMEVHSTYIRLSLFAQTTSMLFIKQTVQNNCVCSAVISKMLLTQHNVHNYYTYKQCCTLCL